MTRAREVDVTRLIAGALAIVTFSIVALVVMPYILTPRVATEAKPVAYTANETRGRAVYIANGCVYCHSQQPRDPSVAPDGLRGWGRPSVPNDYVRDEPHLLGTMRTGPDLFNIGARQPSQDWHLGHLYQPRAYTPGSIMPAFPFLFAERRGALEPGDVVITLPPGVAPAGVRIVAREDAMRLVDYLLSLDHTYPVSSSSLRGGSR